MKLTTTAPITISRFHKRSSKGSSYKKFLINQKSINGVKREIFRETSPCDNSNDSSLGSENKADYLYNSTVPHPSVFKFVNSQKRSIDDSFSIISKRHRSSDGKEQELDDGYSFPPSHVALPNTNSVCYSGGMQTSVPAASKAIRRSLVPTKRLPAPVTLTSQLSSTSRNGKVGLQILNQPEQQHRARYQTEGSRGAVKDRTGNSFPVVKVTGYNRPTTLQVFIGSDQGRVTPHMFYQACRVTGKNSTPCIEKNIDGTIVIEIDIEPTKEMTVTCDCVGILKERNVDVEHRFPEECSTRSKKKSTRCRMVFRSVITNDDGSTETLQIASQPIACTQPPGIPEICKKSLTNCPAAGGQELFVLGKNFLKDTHVQFNTDDWEQTVTPDKEYLQQTHLVCVVPAYKNLDISEPVAAKVTIISGNRASEPHSFTYTPIVPVSASSLTCSTSSSSSVRSKLTSTKNTQVIDFSGMNSATPVAVDSSPDPDEGLTKTAENIKMPNSPADECENVNPSVLLWSTSNNQSSSPSSRNCTYVQNTNSKTMSMSGPLLRPSAISLGRGPSAQMIVPKNVVSVGSAAKVLSNASPSRGAQSPCPNTSDVVVPHYADGVVSRQMSAVVPNYFQSTEAYRNALSDIVDPLPVVIPKLEPLSDGCSTVTNSYQQQATSSPCSSEFSDVVASGLKAGSPPAVGCLSSSDLYSKSQLGAYSNALVASSNDMSVDNMSTFGGIVVGDDSVASCNNSNLSPAFTSSTTSRSGVVESSNYASLVNSDGTTYSAAATAISNATVLMSSPTNDSRTSEESAANMANLAEPAYDRINTAVDNKSKTYQFNQLFEMKSNQQPQHHASYENLHAAAVAASGSAICYKNALMGVDQQQQHLQVNSTLAVYQNYHNFAGGDSSSSTSVVDQTSSNESTRRQMVDSSSMAVSNGCSLLSMVKSSASASLMVNGGGSESTADLLARQRDECSFLNAVASVASQKQQSQSTGEAYDTINSILADNGSVNTVPKLEAMVNDAAENHIRSSMGLLSPSANDHVPATNCDLRESPSSMSLEVFMSPSSQQQQQQTNGFVSSAMDDATAGSLLTSYSHLMAPTSNQSLAGSVYNKMSSSGSDPSLVQVKNTHIANTADKSANVAGIIEKSDDGVFASEITRMTKSDLLSYINPSCFDQVGMITSIQTTH